MRIERYRKTRYWAVREADGTLLCLCVYKRGAAEVIKRLRELDNAQQWQDQNGPCRGSRWRCHRRVLAVVRHDRQRQTDAAWSIPGDMLVLGALVRK